MQQALALPHSAGPLSPLTTSPKRPRQGPNPTSMETLFSSSSRNSHPQAEHISLYMIESGLSLPRFCGPRTQRPFSIWRTRFLPGIWVSNFTCMRSSSRRIHSAFALTAFQSSQSSGDFLQYVLVACDNAIHVFCQEREKPDQYSNIIESNNGTCDSRLSREHVFPI